jgi:hypothetical protein
VSVQVTLSAGSRFDAIDVEACYRYTLGCQTSRGGFCFYAYPQWGVEDPNTLDTYAAVAMLRLLRRPVPEVEHCTTWLKAQQDALGGYSTLVIGYAALKALQLLGAEPLRDPRRFLHETAGMLRLTDPSGRGLTGWISSALRCIELWRDYGIAVSEQIRFGGAAALGRLHGADGGYGAPGSSLPETAAAVALATALGLPVGPEALAYARQCEGEPYGFNVARFAVSSGLESQRAGLQVLRHFGAASRYPAAIRKYVVSCQTFVGGFGRAPGAIPRLTDSLCAMEILSMLA